jgi:hypothetical protein
MTWEPSDIIAVVAVSIALASLVQTLLDRRAVRHAKTIQALQEEKEAVAYVAFHVSEGRIPEPRGGGKTFSSPFASPRCTKTQDVHA